MLAMVIAAGLGFLVAAGLTPLLAGWARGRGLLDVPNARSSHSVATPRIGGIALVVAVLLGAAAGAFAGVGPDARATVTLGLAAGMALLGLVDDIYSLPALVRLVMQLALAVLAVALLGPASQPWLPCWLAAGLTVFWIVSVTNAVNFMDGVDGMAGAQAIVAGLGWGLLGQMRGWDNAALLGSLIAFASLGFLLHNWQPARVFMGDAGSAFLGSLLALVPLTVPSGETWALWCGVLLTWPFLFDTGFTLLRRIGRGENILSAHRSHLYQRYTQTRRSHQRVVVVYAGLAVLGLLAAVLLAAAKPLPSVALIGSIPLAAFWLWRAVTSRETTYRSTPPQLDIRS